jgi:hypothetical protein
MNQESSIDKGLLQYLDNYSTDVLQKTALLLLEKSLSRTSSFELPTAPLPAMNFVKSSNLSEKESTKHEVMSDDSSEFKPCNCRKSKCLKLYCECFSNGRKCTSKCDCSHCCNTVAHEDLILKSKEQIMARNPDAFKPKFNETEEAKKSTKTIKHQRGCNCQKSNCLKKYCECFQMGVECSDLCRCVGCHNCKSALGKKESHLGKRQRETSACDPALSVQLPPSQPSYESKISLPLSSAYSLKPRRAKENRYPHFEDYAVEPIARKI